MRKFSLFLCVRARLFYVAVFLKEFMTFIQTVLMIGVTTHSCRNVQHINL